jgi:hypothetical protein
MKCEATPNKVELDPGDNGDSAWWKPGDDKTYIVLFRPDDGKPGSGTPFKDQTNNERFYFPVNSSGVKSGTSNKHGYYEYSINDSSGNQCKDPKDPGVIVH